MACYAISFSGEDTNAGQTVDLFASIDRTSAGADRVDIHAVIAGSTPITEDQVLDSLSYMAQAFETQDLSLGEVSFEAISQYSQFNLPDLADVVSEPTGAGATDRAITVIFVDHINQGPSNIIGISAGLPGLIGTDGTAGSAVVVAVSTFMASPTPNLEGLGLDVAHEVGHFLGLNHTTQINWDSTYGWLHDFLPDTPECTNGIWVPTPDGPVLKIFPSTCVGAGAENVMFPILVGSLDGISFTEDQGTVLSSTAPGPLTVCADHADCGDDELCIASECERAWARDYFVYIDGADISVSAPSGNWDPFGGAPDPYVSWVIGWGLDSSSDFTATVTNSYSPIWNESDEFFALKSATYANFALYDYDPIFADELIDVYFEPAPLPLEWLRSPYLPLTASWSSFDIGFAPQ